MRWMKRLRHLDQRAGLKELQFHEREDQLCREANRPVQTCQDGMPNRPAHERCYPPFLSVTPFLSLLPSFSTTHLPTSIEFLHQPPLHLNCVCVWVGGGRNPHQRPNLKPILSFQDSRHTIPSY